MQSKATQEGAHDLPFTVIGGDGASDLTTKRCYAGIGARSTPTTSLSDLTEFAGSVTGNWTLSSGGADGADSAFSDGARDRRIWIPWDGYNGLRHGGDVIDCKRHPRWREMQKLASDACSSPYDWAYMNQGVRALFVRNAFVIALGSLDRPVDAIVYWNKESKRRGGTAHALRIAAAVAPNAPLINFGERGLDVGEALLRLNGPSEPRRQPQLELAHDLPLTMTR